MRRLLTRRRLVVLLGATTLVVVFGMLWRSAIKRNLSVPDEPFRIAGNPYYGGPAVTPWRPTG